MSLKGKLNRFKKEIIRDTVSSSMTKSNQIANEEITTTDIPFLKEWKSFGAEVFYFDDSYCLVREVKYPLSYQHGLYCFEELKEVVAEWNYVEFNHPLSSKGLRAEELFFFDTETTGLGGGVGNVIFLLGHARIVHDSLVVTQHFLPNPGSEIALYQSFLSSVNYKTLVTYNGKSFDWPQVKTRHTLIRDELPNLPEFGHFDLYHASRRLWKGKLESVKLVNVEKEVLGIKRDGDIPGFLAPMLYFDFVENKNPEGIFGVLQHNETDILSLITLYIHLSKNVFRLSLKEASEDQYEISRWFHALGEISVAEDGFKQVIQSKTGESTNAKMALATIYKKQHDFKRAMFYFYEVYRDGDKQLSLKASIELAKLFEHREKDLEKALFFARKAQEGCKLIKNREVAIKLTNEIDKRINRLVTRMNKI